MKLKDFHKMVGITNEEQRKTYYRIHMLGIYSCQVCDEIVTNLDAGCPVCGKGKDACTLYMSHITVKSAQLKNKPVENEMSPTEKKATEHETLLSECMRLLTLLTDSYDPKTRSYTVSELDTELECVNPHSLLKKLRNTQRY